MQNEGLRSAISSKLQGNSSTDAQVVLKSVKNTIKSWNSEVNGNINRKIEVIESRITELEDLDNHELELNIAKEELEELLSIKDSRLK